MFYKDIYPGDQIIDSVDGRLRTVYRVAVEDPNDPHGAASVYMTDGGCMDSEDIDRVWPASEIVPKSEFY